MLCEKQPAPGVGDAVRAAADVGHLADGGEDDTFGRKDASGTVWATPLGQELLSNQPESTYRHVEKAILSWEVE